MSQVHWLALASISGLGGVTAHKLPERFGDIEAIFRASASELIAIPRVTREIAEQIGRAPFEQLEKELYGLSEEEIDLLTWEDEGLPSRLRELPDAPVVLFLRGRLQPSDESAVAIVGTRQPSAENLERASILARELALRGLTIVSGLAMGIDTAAHRSALEAEGGRTLAVLGSGIRVIHPRQNTELAERIARDGALLSELMPNVPPRGPQLMARDRIVSGLSQAVIVVEAGAKSGSLDTAAKARKQKRAVFAFPGSPGSDGLLRGGASALDWDSLDFDALAREIQSGLTTRGDRGLRQPKLL